MYRPWRSSSYMDGYHHYYDYYPQSNHLTSVRSLGRTFWSGEDTGPDLWFEGNDLWRAQPTRRPRCSCFCCLFLFYTRLPLIFISNLTALLLSLFLHLSLYPLYVVVVVPLDLVTLTLSQCSSSFLHVLPALWFSLKETSIWIGKRNTKSRVSGWAT